MDATRNFSLQGQLGNEQIQSAMKVVLKNYMSESEMKVLVRIRLLYRH